MKTFEIWRTNNYVHASRPPNDLVNKRIEAESQQAAVEKHTGENVRRSGRLDRGRIVWATESGAVYIVNELSAERIRDLDDFDKWNLMLADVTR